MNEVRTLVVRGKPQDLLPTLFVRGEGGGLVFGWATTKRPSVSLSGLADWTEFRDYIMEGFVSYALRVRQVEEGLVLEVRLSGNNRDEYVMPTIRWYVRQAGIEPIDDLT